MLLQFSHFFFPLFPSALHPASHQHSLTLSSCPWVIHISSLASPFPVLFLISYFLFSTHHLCYLFPIPFPLLSPSHSLLITLHVISISVILLLFQLFAQFAFVFVLGVLVNNCEFAVICTIHIFFPSFSQVTPFNISYNKGLVMMNFFNLILSEKHFIFPSILNDSFARYSNLGCRSLLFMTWNTSFQPLLACKVYFENSARLIFF